MKISVLDWNTMTMNNDISAAPLETLGEVTVYESTSPSEAAEHIGSAEAVLCNKVPITREVIDKCPDLRYIGLFATGYNNIDVEYASEKGITVCNAGQYSTDAVAQQVFAYILDYFNKIRLYGQAVKEGKWESSPCFSYFPISTGELSGKNLSIIGFGSIGRRTAEIGRAFGMNIIVSTRTVPENCPYEVTDILTAAKKADVLTLHCPLTPRTEGIINRRLLSSMKPSAILINTSRGGTVVEEDLTEALNSGTISAAYLDVLRSEPMSPDTPLKHAKNCLITPHTSWAALETRERLLGIVCRNFTSWLSDSPENKVN